MATYQNNIKPLEDTYIVLQSRTAVKSGTYYNWTLNRPIQINENAYLSVVERFYESYTIPVNGAMPYLIRMIPNSSSIVHPVNATPSTSVLEGTIIDIGYDHEPASRQIEVQLPSQQTINEITIQLTKTLTGRDVISSVPEFVIIIKIVEREPRNLRYGALNNIQQ
jgi:hypothetical protein